LWALVDEDLTEHIALSNEPVARHWIFPMIKEIKRKDDLIRLFVTMWAIWHAKRKAVHEDHYQSPMATMAFVNRFIADLGKSKELGGGGGGGTKKKVQVKKWMAPPAGHMKINVDAAVAKSVPKEAVGVICRSPEGLFVGALAVVFDGITHPGSLEALACREAMDTAEDLQLGRVRIASDCTEVINGLQGVCLGVFGTILREVRDRAAQRGDTYFVHEGRESNGEAHRLARFASTLPVGRYVWFVQPPDGVNIPVSLADI
jgi:hypothetical protein